MILEIIAFAHQQCEHSFSLDTQKFTTKQQQRDGEIPLPSRANFCLFYILHCFSSFRDGYVPCQRFFFHCP